MSLVPVDLYLLGDVAQGKEDEAEMFEKIDFLAISTNMTIVSFALNTSYDFPLTFQDYGWHHAYG